jgi:hypothetical protein
MDKVGKPTGEGKVSDRAVNDGHGVLITANLYNYNFDGNMLKDEHKEYLDKKMLPFLKKYPTHVKLHGVASKKGNADYNRQLSLERVLRVKQYLISKGLSEAQVPGSEMRATGEDLVPEKNGDDEEFDRAVRIILALGRKWKPWNTYIVFPPDKVTGKDPPEDKPPPIGFRIPPLFKRVPIKVSRNWRIKLLGAADFGLPITPLVSVGASALVFALADMENQQHVVCILEAGQVGGPGTPGTLTMEGPWQPFSTANPHRITEFAGGAAWSTLYTSGPYSMASLTLRNIPRGQAGSVTSVLAKEVEMGTGFTFGAGVFDHATGTLTCSEPQPGLGPP